MEIQAANGNSQLINYLMYKQKILKQEYKGVQLISILVAKQNCLNWKLP